MLTRLKVKGFKNLVDVDIRFGPFTCIAGPNAAGKSNLFDAIRFLSASANRTLMEAAFSVRSEKAANADVRSLFHKVGDRIVDQMLFEAEMIVPPEVTDDLGMSAKATARFLRYSLVLRYREASEPAPNQRIPIEILKEELVGIPLKQAGRHLLFPHNVAKWRKTALRVESRKNRKAPYISTVQDGMSRTIRLHGDGGSRGPAVSNPATQFRTVLSVVNVAENPTVLCAKREMESWQLLQLEPAALREPDPVNAPIHLDSNGAHLAATVYHLAETSAALSNSRDRKPDPDRVYCEIANRLRDLIEDISTIHVDRDEKRELLTLEVTGRDGTRHPARSLSDGTLRFLALAVLELDAESKGVICLEEPENGIHPERIPAILGLLNDIATDPEEPVDETNPLRQVIVNTHSPAVVLETADDSLLVVESKGDLYEGQPYRKAVFGCLPGTWREKAEPSGRIIPKGKLLAYLNPIPSHDEAWAGFYEKAGRRAVGAANRPRRVVDREDLQPSLFRVAE